MISEIELRTKLATDERWVRRALIRLLERQTSFEQQAQTTSVNNLMGFQSCDAKWFTRVAQFAVKYPDKVLSEKQLKIVRRSWRGQPAICKYAGQLLQVIKEDTVKCGNTKTEEASAKASMVSAHTCSYCGCELPKCDCYWNKEFAKQEAEQERMAFMSDQNLFPHHVDFGSAA